MEKEVFNGVLGFWDYIAIAFRTKFRPSTIAEVGPARGTLYALPNGKTFFRASPPTQLLRPLASETPLPMPEGSVIPLHEALPNVFAGNTSSSFELDDAFEDEMKARDERELAELRAKLPPETIRSVTEFYHETKAD